jgi:hypothetical protein
MRQRGEGEKMPRMEGTNPRGRRIPRNTPTVNGPTGPGEGRRQPRKEWVNATAWAGSADKGKKIKRVLIFKFK